MNDIEIKEIIKLLVEYKTNNSKIFELEKYGNKVLEVALDEEKKDLGTDYRYLESYVGSYFDSMINDDTNKLKSIYSYYNEEDLKMGYIICKCNLVDCIYMSEDFINNLKKDNYIEYLCGNYEIGRYAWILKDVKILKYPIKVKGKLGIWNYDR